MTSENSLDPEQKKQMILSIAKEYHGKNVQEAIDIIRQRTQFPVKQIENLLLELEQENKLSFKHNKISAAPGIFNYLLSSRAVWFWAVIAFLLSSILFFEVTNEYSYLPILLTRSGIAAVFILVLPGYTFIRALFSPKYTGFVKGERLSNLETLALSVGISLAVVPITGLLLNYTPWGIQLQTVALSMSGITLVFTLIAMVREYSSLHTHENIAENARIYKKALILPNGR